jgi:hypothetical protein
MERRLSQKLLLLTGWLVFALCLPAQQALTNDAIVKLAKAGLGEDIILNMIASQPSKFSVGAEDLVALKKNAVSDKVIAAMMTKASNTPAPAPASAATPAPAPTAGTAPVSEVGVYTKKSETWAEVNPEVVNFKTGGVLKTIGTAGVVKGDVNGHINGLHSPNQVKTPVEFLIYTHEGVSITEYQLLRLRDQKNSREFRTVTGGVMHVSGGATRDLVPFESKKIAPRTYLIVLPNIGSGEYGFLPPAGSDSTSSSGRLGKVYSFRLLE